MNELKVVVCMKVVPKPEEIRVDTETGWLRREQVRSEINPPDMNAIEIALKLKDQYGGRVDILSMGPTFFNDYLPVPLAMGADHIYLLSDKAFSGADTLATTYTLAAGIRKMGDVDLIFCGEESSDGATGQVPPGIAEWLDIRQLTMVTGVDVNPNRNVVRGRREFQGGYQILEVPMPAVISVKTAANEPRFMDFRIKSWAYEPEQVTVWGKADLAVDPELIGEAGSPTRVSQLTQAPDSERKREFIKGDIQEITRFLMGVIFDT
jgi:electron transfer flavoprotein beta subunit